VTTRVLSLTAVAAAVIVGVWLVAASLRRPAPLRSRHSDPGTAPAPALVAVTAEGKLYHASDCTFIHGPVRTESSAEAIAAGYTPCVRCLKR
jgi:hypothetical protein